MAPPQYADLGKTARDLFNKGYNYGTVKLDVKTRTKNQIDFNMTGEHNTDVQKSLGTLEAKYKAPAHGITFVEKWNTDNILKCELTVEDTLLKGLKLSLDSSFAPASGFVLLYSTANFFSELIFKSKRKRIKEFMMLKKESQLV
jgi:hypothetical protein